MFKLRVRPPQIITRVTEHIPDIIHFIENIESAGYAYRSPSSSSVYFDSQKFKADFFHYHILRDNPSTILTLSDESNVADVRRHPDDFALWKGNRSEGLFWDSPFGPGRPGWHIECSAMAHSALCNAFPDHPEWALQLDLHSGGCDLEFPHHNNEILQSLAFIWHQQRENRLLSSTQSQPIPQWPHYLIHTGHVRISGDKMSKSLKNFITIQQFMETSSINQFRIMCLQTPYAESFDFTPSRRSDAAIIENRLANFFHQLSFFNKQQINSSQRPIRWGSKDQQLFNS